MKDKQINIRLTTEQEIKIKELAKRQGLSKSEYIRFLIFKNIEGDK